jgi:hypothetical protein
MVMVPAPLVLCCACCWRGLEADAIEASPGVRICPVCREPDPIPERPGPGEVAAVLTIAAVALGTVLGIAL